MIGYQIGRKREKISKKVLDFFFKREIQIKQIFFYLMFSLPFKMGFKSIMDLGLWTTVVVRKRGYAALRAGLR